MLFLSSSHCCRYHLSDFTTYGKNETAKKMNIFLGRVLPNWAIISAPRHPFIIRSLENVVEIIRHEYLMDPVMRNLWTEFRWQSIMCSTGPSMMTASARQVTRHVFFLHGYKWWRVRHGENYCFVLLLSLLIHPILLTVLFFFISFLYLFFSSSSSFAIWCEGCY